MNLLNGGKNPGGWLLGTFVKGRGSWQIVDRRHGGWIDNWEEAGYTKAMKSTLICGTSD